MTYLIDSFPEKLDWAELTGSKGMNSKANNLTNIPS
jgi:hypothetical protein